MNLINRRVIYPSIMATPEIFHRKGAIGVVRNITGNDFLLLISESIQSTEVYQKLTEKFLVHKNINQEIIKFASEDQIMKIVKKYKDWPPDVVIAIGGGKVLDSAKLIRQFLSFPEEQFQDIQKQFSSPNPTIGLVAIPSTPNTGSEVNITSVIKNNRGIKIPYVNKALLPDIAILDPTLMLTIPSPMMGNFVADIFTHAYEGSLSRLSTSFMQQLASRSLQLLEKNYNLYKKDPENLEILGAIQYSGQQAGIVAGNAYVGMIHAMAHSLETLTDCTHGQALQALLGICLDWQANWSDNPMIPHFKEVYDNINLEEDADLSLIANVDVTSWADLSIKDPSIKTDFFHLKEPEMLEMIKWVQKQAQK